MLAGVVEGNRLRCATIVGYGDIKQNAFFGIGKVAIAVPVEPAAEVASAGAAAYGNGNFSACCQRARLPFSAFVFRVAQNTLIDYYRKAGRKPKTVSLDDDTNQLQELLANPLDLIHQRMEAKTLREALVQLNDDYREVLVLRFLEGLSPQETADTMRRSEGAIRVLQHRALGALRKLLQPLAGAS